MERQHAAAVAGRALREHHHAAACVEAPLEDRQHAQQIALARAVDEHRADGAAQPAEQRPARDVGLRDEGRAQRRAEHDRVEVAQVVRDQQERAARRLAAARDAQPDDARRAARPVVEEREAKPRYDQKRFSEESKKGVWKLLVSPDGRDGSIAIRQDAQIYATILEKGQSLTHAIRAGRHAWLQVVAGGLTVEGQHVYAGDGIAVSEQSKVEVLADTAAEVLLFDLS